MKALIVDDSISVRKMVRSYLETTGTHEIIEAECGLTALSIVQQNQDINLVITDIVMPKMTGIEFVRNLKKDKTCDHIGIVFMTTDTTKENIREAVKLGAIHLLRKPLSQETFINTIKKVLSDLQNNRILLKHEEKLEFLDKLKAYDLTITICEDVISIKNDDVSFEVPFSRAKFFRENTE